MSQISSSRNMAVPAYESPVNSISNLVQVSFLESYLKLSHYVIHSEVSSKGSDKKRKGVRTKQNQRKRTSFEYIAYLLVDLLHIVTGRSAPSVASDEKYFVFISQCSVPIKR